MAHKSKDKSDCVSLDLFVGDEDDEPHSSSQNAVETLCLRILSKRGINYRFGGLQLHVKSPDFHIGKSFHVNLDENNRIDSIESYREPEDAYIFGRRRVSLLGSNNLGTSPARILITPKKPPESEAGGGAVAAAVPAGESTNGTANKASAAKQMPILTADVVVEEIRPPEKSIPENAVQPSQSLGSALVNTLLNKRSNNHSSTSSLANSNANSPSQSIHSINSLSSSMLELRTSSPIDPTSSSPEKLISKLTLQAFGHSERESKYIKNKKNKKYDFKKRSKEKLLKNGEKNAEKNQENGSGQQTAGVKSVAVVDKKPENCKQPDKSVPAREEPKEAERVKEKLNEKVTEKVNSECDKKLASDHNLSIEPAKTHSVQKQTKSIGVSTHLDASCLSLNLQQGFFFFNLRRTRSWKK